MPASKGPRRVDLAFVHLDGDDIAARNRTYRLVPASSAEVGSLPAPDTEFKLLRLQLQSLYIEHLPDFTNRVEGLLKLTGHTRSRLDKANKESLTYGIEFRVKNRDYAPGFLQRMVFRNVLIRQFLELGVDLVELDKNLSDTFEKVATVVNESGLSTIDAINSIPYLKVATNLFSGLIKTFGKNADDPVWRDLPTLDLHPIQGGAYLRSGIYVLYENRSIFKTRKGKAKPGRPMPLKDLVYRDGKIRHGSDQDFPLSNHLVFGISVEPFDET